VKTKLKYFIMAISMCFLFSVGPVVADRAVENPTQTTKETQIKTEKEFDKMMARRYRRRTTHRRTTRRYRKHRYGGHHRHGGCFIDSLQK